MSIEHPDNSGSEPLTLTAKDAMLHHCPFNEHNCRVYMCMAWRWCAVSGDAGKPHGYCAAIPVRMTDAQLTRHVKISRINRGNTDCATEAASE